MTVNNVTADTMHEIIAACHALEDMKAEDLRVLHLGARSSITDYYIVASGNSAPHLRALKNSVESAMKANGIKISSSDNNSASGWMVIDAFDFMVHLFLPEQREHYGLETLWKDADIVEPLQMEGQLQSA